MKSWLLIVLISLPNRLLLKIAEKIKSTNWANFLYWVAQSKRRSGHRFYTFRPKKSRPLEIIAYYEYRTTAGMTDRFKGMVSLYRYCLERGIAFRIVHTNPYELKDYVVPNKYNWELSASPRTTLYQQNTFFIAFSSNGYRTHTEEAQLFIMNKLVNLPYIERLLVSCNATFGLDNLSQDFSTLFAPSLKLRTYWDNLSYPSKYVSVTFRFVNCLGDSDENPFNQEPLLQVERDILVSKCIEVLSRIRKKCVLPIFVTSDSPMFLRILDNQFSNDVFGVKTNLTETHHIGWGNAVSDIQNLKSFTEFFLISRAEHAFLVHIPPMYKSGFPKIAASIGRVPFTIIEEDD